MDPGKWLDFAVQEPARRNAEQRGVWSYAWEKGPYAAGKKMYAAASARAAHAKYLATPKEHRCMYFCIYTPDADTPENVVKAETAYAIRAYADCEYEPQPCPACEGDDALAAECRHMAEGRHRQHLNRRALHENFVEAFRLAIEEAIDEDSGVRCTPRIEISYLDASTDAKFSRHYIAYVYDERGDEVLFRNAAHVGAMIRRLAQARPDMRVGPNHFFFDKGVYTRHRLFRAPGCTKAYDAEKHPEKYRPLRDSETGADEFPDFHEWAKWIMNAEEGIRDSAVIVDVIDVDGLSPVFTSALVPPRSKKGPTQVPGAGAGAGAGAGEGQVSLHAGLMGDVAAVVGRHVDQVHGAAASSTGASVRFYVKGRDCRIKGSEHQSNNVIFRVTRDGRLLQGCHDDICRQSPEVEVPLPPAVQVKFALVREISDLLSTRMI
jgi:hypothetical protein